MVGPIVFENLNWLFDLLLKTFARKPLRGSSPRYICSYFDLSEMSELEFKPRVRFKY